ncbi:MAG: CrcB family protein [Elusimicrobiota bacterium]|jgi:CrcB protein
MGEIASLALGSLVGGFGRYFLGGAVQRAAGGGFPYGTLFINVAGCFLIGLFHGWAAPKLSAHARLLLMTGFCGAFTTFSTLILDSSLLLDQGKASAAMMNLFLSLLLGFFFLRLGVFLSSARAVQTVPVPVAADARGS